MTVKQRHLERVPQGWTGHMVFLTSSTNLCYQCGVWMQKARHVGAPFVSIISLCHSSGARMSSVLKKRRKKMRKHKHKKLRRRQKFLRRRS